MTFWGWLWFLGCPRKKVNCSLGAKQFYKFMRHPRNWLRRDSSRYLIILGILSTQTLYNGAGLFAYKTDYCSLRGFHAGVYTSLAPFGLSPQTGKTCQNILEWVGILNSSKNSPDIRTLNPHSLIKDVFNSDLKTFNYCNKAPGWDFHMFQLMVNRWFGFLGYSYGKGLGCLGVPLIRIPNHQAKPRFCH